MAKKNWTIPYLDGKPYFGFTPWQIIQGIEQRPSDTEFEDTLTVTGTARATKTPHITLSGSDGYEYQMLLSHFIEAVPYLEKGVLKGRFGFGRVGSAYGIVFIP